MTVTVQPHVRAKVLRNFASGGRPAAMSAGVAAAAVEEILESVGHDQARAREAAQALRTQPAPAVEPATRDGDFIAAAPQPASPVARVDIAATLADADEAGGAFAATADRIRAIASALADELAQHRQVAEAEALVERLRAELDHATGRLAALKPGSAVKAGRSREESRAARAWAARNGVDCPALGRVPQRVWDAYAAAGGAA
ncbi:Lsr2 family DNA-binding protein [Dactylosporangium sp. CA-139066]|uniref:Lsr2 family DNA-binding protein n=1 Tax=Dactylosporangium sp. CA-139066 TaxID=3239930 RepID=UPI003D8A3615